MAVASADYPVRLQVDYPDTPRNRMTVFFRLFTVIPIAVILILLSGGPNFTDRDSMDRDDGQVAERRADSRAVAGAGRRSPGSSPSASTPASSGTPWPTSAAGSSS